MKKVLQKKESAVYLTADSFIFMFFGKCDLICLNKFFESSVTTVQINKSNLVVTFNS